MPEGAFNKDFEPAAREGDIVRLVPKPSQRQFRMVDKLEQLPDLGPIDFGAADAGSTSVDSVADVTEIELREDQLGQFRFSVISPVEVGVRQPGEQSQRFITRQNMGHITPETRDKLTELFVFGNDVPYFEVTNPNPFDLQQTLVQADGYRMFLSDPLGADEVTQQEVNVTVGRLDERAQRR